MTWTEVEAILRDISKYLMKLGGPYCNLPPGKQAYQAKVCIRCEKDLEEKMRTK